MVSAQGSWVRSRPLLVMFQVAVYPLRALHVMRFFSLSGRDDFSIVPVGHGTVVYAALYQYMWRGGGVI